jgi:hypothetical protein
MRFIRLVAAEEIKLLMAFIDRLPQAENRREATGFVGQSIRIDATLVGIRRTSPGHVVFGGSWTTIQSQPRHPQFAACERSADNVSMKFEKRP